MEDESPSRLRSDSARRPASGEVARSNRSGLAPVMPPAETTSPPSDLETPMSSRIRRLRESRSPEAFQEPAPIPEFN
ncbi:MAG: hypothetical protein SNJ67_06035, partial [Chloracidobacterium sp.]